MFASVGGQHGGGEKEAEKMLALADGVPDCFHLSSGFTEQLLCKTRKILNVITK